MSYLIKDRRNDTVFSDGTLDEARNAIKRLIRAANFTPKELASKKIIPTSGLDEEGVILEEEYIFTYEDKDERIVFATIKHDSVLEE